MRVGLAAILVMAVAVLGLAAYVRLAPFNPAIWHTALPTDTRQIDGDNCADAVDTQTKGAMAACMVNGSATQVLAKLNATALATPRTRLVAGSPDEGRMTWETRSAFWGFPDYTTAQAQTRGDQARIEIIARLRFGGSDFGVNAARLRAWLSAL